MELILREDAIDATAEFDRIVRAYRSKRNWPDLFDGSHEEFWRDIVDGGWTTVPPDEIGPMFSLQLAETWGWGLVPLPFVTTLLARRHLNQDDDTYKMLSLPVADRLGCTRAPYGDAAGVEIPSIATSTQPHAAAVEVDRFAPSLSLAVLGNTTAGVSGNLLRDVRAHVAAEALGAAVHAFEDSVEYTKIRVAYGSPIGKFQAVQHILANMFSDIELARSAYMWAAIPEEGAMSERAARLSLLYSRKIVEAAIQVHGGIGYTWELGLHYYLRHVLALQTLTGLM